MMHTINTTLPELPKLAKQIAKILKGGEVLALVGNLGSGKTTFTQLLARELKIKSVISSPTFIIMNRHQGKLFSGKKIFLYHLDLYRAKNIREVRALGITEHWNRPDSVVIIEWANKIKKHLPSSSVLINFQGLVKNK